MWGDAAWGEVAYGELADGEVSPFQDRNVFAIIEIIAAAVGARTEPSSGAAGFGFSAVGVGNLVRKKVRVIQTNPHGPKGKTDLSHTGLN